MSRVTKELARPDFRSPAMAGKQFRAMKVDPSKLPWLLSSVRAGSATQTENLVRGALATAKTRAQYVAEATQMFRWARQGTTGDRRMLLRSLHENRGEAADLFAVHQISRMTRTHARQFMKDYFAVGGGVEPVAHWLRLAGKVLLRNRRKRRGTAGAVVDAIGSSFEWVVDAMEDAVDEILEDIESIVDAVIQAGVSLASIFTAIGEWTLESVTTVLEALFEAGVSLGKVIADMARLAYAACETFVQAMLDLGKAVAEILAEVVSVTYWHLRRIINGLMKALGPVGDILGWAWSLAANAADAIWHKVLLAIRFADGVLTEALDWALSQGAAAMEALVRAWESIGEDLLALYRWAADQAMDVWDYIGQATARIGNSIYYVLEYLKEDLIPGLFDFARGLLRAGFAIAELVAWAVEQIAEATYQVVAALLDMGATIAELVVAVITRPTEAFQSLMTALDDLGATLSDLYDSVIVETGEEFLEQVTLALHEIGKAAKEILIAILEIATGAIWTVCAVLLNTLSTYRPMTAQEIQDARRVYGSQLDYSKIWFSEESAVNDIIFAIQGLFGDDSNSRAFTTNTLVNFDPDDGPLDRPTMIHELLHVWQSLVTGPFYMSEAIYAQNTAAKYNYGYDEGVSSIMVPIDYAGQMTSIDEGFITGMGAEPELAAAAGDFDEFNREQQGQIIMHYYVRRHLLARDRADWLPWLPYAQVVNPAVT